MVKGNKERRQELAARRKEDKAQEVERKRGGASLATPVEVRASLLSDARGNESQLIGWVVRSRGAEGEEEKAWCEDWFRTGYCLLKRCRNSHEVTISHLLGVPPQPGVPVLAAATTSRGRSVSPAARRVRALSAERGGVGTVGGGGAVEAVVAARPSNKDLSCVPSAAVFPALEPMPLRSCEVGAKLVYDRTLRTQIRTESPLRFVEWGGKLVFDLYNPSVFATYCETAIVLAAPITGSLHLGEGTNLGGGVEGERAVEVVSVGARTEEAKEPQSPKKTTLLPLHVRFATVMDTLLVEKE